MKTLKRYLRRIGITGELFSFLWHNKKWWLIPLIVILVIFGILLILQASSAMFPFLYPFF